MKKQILILALVGWFFGMQHSFPNDETILVRYIIGPFQSKAACEAERIGALEFFKFHPSFVSVGCVERKEA